MIKTLNFAEQMINQSQTLFNSNFWPPTDSLHEIQHHLNFLCLNIFFRKMPNPKAVHGDS